MTTGLKAGVNDSWMEALELLRAINNQNATTARSSK
jgi:hypothetical protein